MVMCLFLVPWAAQGVGITDTVIASKRKLKLWGEKRRNSHIFRRKGEITALPALSSTFQLPLPWLQLSNNHH